AEDGIRDRNVTGVQTCVFRSCTPSAIVRTSQEFVLPIRLGSKCTHSTNQKIVRTTDPLGEPNVSLPRTGGSLVDRGLPAGSRDIDRKSTRLNSSHVSISYAVF